MSLPLLSGMRSLWVLAPLGVWLVVYPPLLLLGHYTLGTHALDLSVFDYAVQGCYVATCGDVPFLGHSLRAHHVMPTLYLLTPLHWLWPSPVFLILVQVAAVVAAALLFWRVLAERTPLASMVLLILFLFSRRSHSAIVSVFYPESWLLALTLLAYIAAQQRRWWWFWVATVLALGVREDVGIYFAVFGLMLLWRGAPRVHAVSCVAVSVLWVLVSTMVVLPAEREAEGLSRENPFVAERIGPDPVAAGVARVASVKAAGKVAGVLGAAGALPLLAPLWLLPAVPGVLLNLSVKPEFLQSGLLGHYLWPILPWLWIAAAQGLARLEQTKRRVALGWSAIMLVVVIADSPLRPSRIRARWVNLDAAREVTAAIGHLPTDVSILAQPQLIPHLPKSRLVQAMAGTKPETPAAIVLFSELGDQWPLSAEQWAERRAAVAADPRCRVVDTATKLVRFDCQ